MAKPLLAMLPPILIAVAANSGAVASIDLTWDAPVECPSAHAITSRLNELLPADPSGTSRVSVGARARPTPNGDWVLDVTLDSPEGPGRRQIQGESCEAVMEALVLFISLAVTHPDSSLPAPLPEPSPERKPIAPTAPPDAPPPDAAPPISPRALHLAIGLHAVPDFGTLPEPIPGARLTLAMDWQSFRIQSVATHWFEQRVRSTADRTAGGLFSLSTVGVQLQYRFWDAPLAISASLGGEYGWLLGRGFGVETPQSQTISWPTLTLGAMLAWPLNQWLTLCAQPTLALSRAQPGFRIENVGRIHRPGPLVFRLPIGAELRF